MYGTGCTLWPTAHMVPVCLPLSSKSPRQNQVSTSNLSSSLLVHIIIISFVCKSLRRIPPIGFFLVEIRVAGPCRGGVHTLHGCVRWSPVGRIWAWRAWRLPGRWLDGGLSEGYRHDGPSVCLGDGQTEAYLKDMGMTGLASAWAMARRRPI